MAEQDSRVNILLVDDEPANLLALEAVLESLGQNLVKAHSGEEVLRQLIQRDFAVILLDVLMPGMSGFETAARIRQRDHSRTTPILFMTAMGNPETEMFQAYALGAIDYLVKPFTPAVLRSKVRVLMDIYRKTRELRQLNEALTLKLQSAEASAAALKNENENYKRTGELLRRSEEELKKLNSSLEAKAAGRDSESKKAPAR